MGRKQGYCYVQNETVGKKGSAKIASNVYWFVQEQASKGIKNFFFYSDNCVGQSRNLIVFFNVCISLFQICYKYQSLIFEGGAFAKRMHSAIENVSGNRDAYTEEGWMELIREAAIKKSYEVTRVSQEQTIFTNSRITLTRKNLEWPPYENYSFIKRDFDADYETICICPMMTGKIIF